MKRVDIKYILVIIFPFILTYNILGFFWFRIDSFIDYIKLPYWIVNIDKYLNYIDDKKTGKIFNLLINIDLPTYGTIICIIIALIPFILVFIERYKIKDYLLLFLVISLNILLFTYVHNVLYYKICFKSSYYTGIEDEIYWLFAAFTCVMLLIFTIISWLLSKRLNKMQG